MSFPDVPGPVASQRGHAMQAQGQHCDPNAGVYCDIARRISVEMLRGEMLRNQHDAIHSYQGAFIKLKAHLGADTPAVLAAHNAIQGRP